MGSHKHQSLRTGVILLSVCLLYTFLYVVPRRALLLPLLLLAEGRNLLYNVFDEASTQKLQPQVI